MSCVPDSLKRTLNVNGISIAATSHTSPKHFTVGQLPYEMRPLAWELVEFSTFFEFIETKAGPLESLFDRYRDVCDYYPIVRSEEVGSFLLWRLEKLRDELIEACLANLGYPDLGAQTPNHNFRGRLHRNAQVILDNAFQNDAPIYPGTFLQLLIKRSLRCWGKMFLDKKGKIMLHPGLDTREGVLWHLKRNLPVDLEILSRYPDLLAEYGV
jgi:hypothetical protein